MTQQPRLALAEHEPVCHSSCTSQQSPVLLGFHAAVHLLSDCIYPGSHRLRLVQSDPKHSRALSHTPSPPQSRNTASHKSLQPIQAAGMPGHLSRSQHSPAVLAGRGDESAPPGAQALSRRPLSHGHQHGQCVLRLGSFRPAHAQQHLPQRQVRSDSQASEPSACSRQQQVKCSLTSSRPGGSDAGDQAFLVGCLSAHQQQPWHHDSTRISHMLSTCAW